MDQNAKRDRLPLFGMLLTTVLVLGGLLGLHWWIAHRADIYAQRALAASWREDWDAAETWARDAEAVGASGVLDKVIYDRATALFEAGDFAAARQLYAELGAYREAARQIMACDYKQAEALEAAGDYEAARDAFLAVAGYEDALNRADRCRYALAEALLGDGDTEAAFQSFLALGNFQDAPQRAQALAQELTGEADEALAIQQAQGRMDSWERIRREKAPISIQRVKSSPLRFIFPKEKKPPTSQWIRVTPEKPREKLAGITQGRP